MTGVKIETPYWKHPKHEVFYRKLERAWECGMDELSMEQNDPENTYSPVPYDYVLAGVCAMLEYVLFPGMDFSGAEVDARWGTLTRRIPTNADPILVFWHLRREFPGDFVSRKERHGG